MRCFSIKRDSIFKLKNEVDMPPRFVGHATSLFEFFGGQFLISVHMRTDVKVTVLCWA